MVNHLIKQTWVIYNKKCPKLEIRQLNRNSIKLLILATQRNLKWRKLRLKNLLKTILFNLNFRNLEDTGFGKTIVILLSNNQLSNKLYKKWKILTQQCIKISKMQSFGMECFLVEIVKINNWRVLHKLWNIWKQFITVWRGKICVDLLNFGTSPKSFNKNINSDR